MPSAPKSPTNQPHKKQGAPKAKGAVRAKSGCYTCRIRRKKCDERPNHMNACETCVRLRLECLGFGAKRPDWLRESSTVLVLREKIKAFLASQGMIKGHSGSGPRGSDGEPVILRLNEHNYSSSPSESPQSGILTLSSSAEDFRPLHTTSAIREEQPWSSAPSYPGGLLLHPRHDRPSYGSATHSPTPPQLRHSPAPYSNYNNSDLPYTFEPNNASSNSLVPWYNAAHVNPTAASSFSPLYHATIDDGTDYMDDVMLPQGFLSYLPSDDLLEHYMKTVVGLQYLLADRSKLNDIVLSPLSTNSYSRDSAQLLGDSVRLLAQIHAIRSRAPMQIALESEGVRERYEKLRELLRQPAFDDTDAMASLHVVSSFLFDGGKGEWEEWLLVACGYCENLIKPYSGGVVEALMAVDERQRFLIKTTIWFDVLASVTTLKSPRLLLSIRALCAPHSSGVYDPSVPTPPELSMMSVMGCENTVVWALAETSALAAWKRTQEIKGSLSMPELVTKGLDIGRYIAPPSLPQTDPVLGQLDVLRSSTAEIFHASARIYLASVVSGDHVSVPEIAVAAKDLIRCLQRMPKDAESIDAIVRSTVFGFFICGCFTDDKSYRALIVEYLDSGKGAGNCASVKRMLEEVWNTRSKKRSEPVPWRKMLHANKLLLV